MQLRDFSKTYSFKKLSGGLLGVTIEECKFWDPLRASVRFKATMINSDNKLVEVALLVPTYLLTSTRVQILTQRYCSSGSARRSSARRRTPDGCTLRALSSSLRARLFELHRKYKGPREQSCSSRALCSSIRACSF
jgi:hypothetical protein